MVYKQTDKYTLIDEAASQQFARHLADCLSHSAIITFSGEIGSGKTTFIRAMLQQLGIQSAIKSPTFSLVESYQESNCTIHHFDLYRIHQEEELEYIGFRDYFSKTCLCFIEWPEHAGNLLPLADLKLNLTIQETGRLIELFAMTDLGKQLLTSLMSKL